MVSDLLDLLLPLLSSYRRAYVIFLPIACILIGVHLDNYLSTILIFTDMCCIQLMECIEELFITCINTCL